jgi:hypothetical protein
MMLSALLTIFNKPGGFAEAAALRALQPQGCKGLQFRGIAMLLDSIEILNKIWVVGSAGNENKYAARSSILKC